MIKRFSALLLLLAPALARGAEAPSLVDVAAARGLVARHENGARGEWFFPEIMGSGAALVDWDGDGDLDAYLVQGAVLAAGTGSGKWPSRQDRLLRNDLAGTPRFVDVTAGRVPALPGYGFGVAVSDVDLDGDADLLVSAFGPQALLINGATGSFGDRSRASGVAEETWGVSASFFDADRDGDPDLALARYVRFSAATNPKCYVPSTARDYCGPDAFEPLSTRFFRNLGGGSFEDQSGKVGFTAANGAGLGTVAADFDQDGWIDLYVANDGDPNHLWKNLGGQRFEETGLFAGCALNRLGLAEASMGVDAGDFDRDGDDDLFMTHLRGETNTLFRAEGGGLFEDRTPETGLAAPGLPMTGFGTLWADLDLDGWLDLLVTNGDVRQADLPERQGEPFPFRQPGQLFLNRKGRFEDASARFPDLVRELVGRGAAFGDLDGDGDADVLLWPSGGPAVLLDNRLAAGRPWLGLRLLAARGGWDAVGATAELAARGGRLRRRVHTDGSYASAHDPRVVFALGEAEEPLAVAIEWPGGRRERWQGLAKNLYYTLREPQ